jgi:hypothetical protein
MARKRSPIPYRRGGGIGGWRKCVRNGTPGTMCPKSHKGDDEHLYCPMVFSGRTKFKKMKLGRDVLY